jgi:putative sigma-54 modulation protein
MEFKIKSRNMDLNNELKDRAEKKIKDKMLKYFDKIIKIEVELTLEKNPKIALNNLIEVTVFTGGEVLRAESSGSDMFEAIDKVSNKLERLIKRFRDKLIQRGRKGYESRISSGANVEKELKKMIVKTKTFTLKPIAPEEAVIQMELLGHDFFVFISSETGETAVVYKRKDKNYGLIEPVV